MSAILVCVSAGALLFNASALSIPDYTSAQIKAINTFLSDNPNYFLLDGRGMDDSSPTWSSAGTAYYYDLTTNVGFVANVSKSSLPQTLQDMNMLCWDLSSLSSTDSVILSLSNSWSTANGNNYYKTAGVEVSSLRGSIYRGAGTYQSTSGDDNGKTYYTIEKVTFSSSPLYATTVYLDTSDISSWDGSTAPKIIITDGAGDVQEITMSLCYNKTSVFSYTFDDYVLPDTSFVFSVNGTTLPSSGVTEVSDSTPCYNGTEWVEFVPDASTATIYVKHNFTNAATVVFTKNGSDASTLYLSEKSSGSDIVTGPFEFDFADDSYDGFYIKEGDASSSPSEGNKTQIYTRSDIQTAVQNYGSPLMVTVGGWQGESTRRTLTFSVYTSLADSTLNIPNDTFVRDDDIYYVNSTFYDYYSDEELNGNNRKNLSGSFNHTGGSSDKIQASTFNSAISNYFKNNVSSFSGIQSPLYFGEFTDAGTSHLYDFVWENNNGTPNLVNGSAGARQGLVDSKLSGGRLTISGVTAPYFSESFLRGNNSTGSEVGYVFNSVMFPFIKNSSGYWEFNSADSSQTLRMKRDTNGTYFLDRVGSSNAVYGHTSASTTSVPNFFPFNDSAQSGNPKQLNYAFGLRLDIPFYMTADGKVTMSDGTKQDIVFDFRGDDDVWIFIDDKLVLDIGGDHGAVSGSINFATHTATTTTNQNSSVSFDALSVSEEHTLTMFYMERGIWESNMKITFNFPQANSLEVSKEVVVPDGVNSYFSDAMELLKTDVDFPVSISNLVTSGQTVGINSQTPAVDTAFDTITASSSVSLDTVKNSSVATVTSGGGRSEVLKYYYPGEKYLNDGQSVTDGRSLYISYPDGTIDLSSDQIMNYGYLEFDVYVDDGNSASSPFVALVDADGNRIGAWASAATYSGSNNMGSKSWNTIRVSLSKLLQIEGSTFDYENVSKVQLAYWDDVTVYIDDVRIKAPAQYVQSTGFSKDQDAIPDYGSYAANSLQPVNGAEYTLTDSSSSLHVSEGQFSLSNGQTAAFIDQFRRESYLSINELCDTSVFSVSWTLSEDDAVIASGTGTAVDDGRTEPSPEISSRTTKPSANTILFKSFDSASSESLAYYFDLAVEYTNTLKLGSITIAKELTDGQTDNGEEYTFEIEFSNIAGLGLETRTDPLTPKTVTIKAGETYKIAGIPAGTAYTITESRPLEGQEYTLMSIEGGDQGNDSYTVDISSYSVSGVVTAETSDSVDVYTFTNDINPSVLVEGVKSWANIPDNVQMPSSVTLTLQRKLSGESNSAYETAKDIYGNDIAAITVTNDTDWSFVFPAVPKYNKSGDDKVEYVYRVVETKIGSQPVSDTHFVPSGGTVDQNGQYDILNTYVVPSFELPETGGKGIWIFLLNGAVLASVSAAYLTLRKKTGIRFSELFNI